MRAYTPKVEQPRFQLYDAFAANSFAKPHVFDILRSLSSMGHPAKSVDLSTAAWGVLFEKMVYLYTQTQMSHLHSDHIQTQSRDKYKEHKCKSVCFT